MAVSAKETWCLIKQSVNSNTKMQFSSAFDMSLSWIIITITYIDSFAVTVVQLVECGCGMLVVRIPVATNQSS